MWQGRGNLVSERIDLGAQRVRQSRIIASIPMHLLRLETAPRDHGIVFFRIRDLKNRRELGLMMPIRIKPAFATEHANRDVVVVPDQLFEGS